MKRLLQVVALGLVVNLGTSAAQDTTCPPGDGTLLGVSDLVVLAEPVEAKLEAAGGMYYLRGTYRVKETARGDGADTIAVEFSCIDMANPTTKEPDLGHCPDATGIGLPGFVRDAETFRGTGPQILFLSRAAVSPLDEAKVFGVVNRRPFHACQDQPRAWKSLEDRWTHVKALEPEAAPSPPLAAYDEKVAQKKKAAAKPATGGGCN